MISAEVAILLTSLLTNAPIRPISIGEHTVVKFAEMDDAKQILGHRDEYIGAMSQFDRQVRMRVGRHVSEKEYVQFEIAQILPWKTKHVDRITHELARIRIRLNDYSLPLPEEIILICTTGKEQAGAPYTRSNAIVMPRSTLESPARPPKPLQKILTHEIFHVLSRHSPEVREQLYGIIGFRKCSPLLIPESLNVRRITNPDGPDIGYSIRLNQNNMLIDAVPILLSDTSTFDENGRRTLWEYLKFRLLVVERTNAGWKPGVLSEKEILLDCERVPDFFRQVGKNTKYVIHPDEILAENFVHLVLDVEGLPSPWVVQRMADVLKKN